MTVHELIEKLKQMPEDLEAIIVVDSRWTSPTEVTYEIQNGCACLHDEPPMEAT
jgi:hypothetical protein